MNQYRWIGSLLLGMSCLSSTALGQVEWLSSIDQARIQARDMQRFVLIHFWSETCVPCQKIERNVFSQSPFINALQANFVPVKVNLSLLPDIGREYQITSVPTDIVITPDGREVHRMISPQDMQQYITALNQVSSHARLLQHQPSQLPGSPRVNLPATDLPAQPEGKINPYVPVNGWAAPAAGGAMNYGGQQPPAFSRYEANASGQPTINPYGSPHDSRHPTPNNEYAGPVPPRDSRYIAAGGGQYVENPFFDDRSPGGSPPVADRRPENHVGTPQGPSGRGVPPTEELSAAHMNSAEQRQANPIASPNSHQFAPQIPSGAAPAQGPPGGSSTGNIYSGFASNQPPCGAAYCGPDGCPPGAAPNLTMGGASQPMVGAPTMFGNPIQARPQDGLRSSPQDSGYVAGGNASLPNSTTQPGHSMLAPPSGAPSALPSNPQLGLEGYCPVSLAVNSAWVKGDARFGAVHRGRTYLFAGAEQQRQFLADPDRYGPMLQGYDPVLFRDHRAFEEGRREFGLTYKNRVYLFNSEANLERFWKSPEEFVPAIEQAMRQSDQQSTMWR